MCFAFCSLYQSHPAHSYGLGVELDLFPQLSHLLVYPHQIWCSWGCWSAGHRGYLLSEQEKGLQVPMDGHTFAGHTMFYFVIFHVQFKLAVTCWKLANNILIRRASPPKHNFRTMIHEYGFSFSVGFLHRNKFFFTSMNTKAKFLKCYDNK